MRQSHRQEKQRWKVNPIDVPQSAQGWHTASEDSATGLFSKLRKPGLFFVMVATPTGVRAETLILGAAHKWPVAGFVLATWRCRKRTPPEL